MQLASKQANSAWMHGFHGSGGSNQQQDVVASTQPLLNQERSDSALLM